MGGSFLRMSPKIGDAPVPGNHLYGLYVAGKQDVGKPRFWSLLAQKRHSTVSAFQWRDSERISRTEW
jgi:hypothetical protein